MKKAIMAHFSFMTRVVIDKDKENLAEIVELARESIAEKVQTELAENLSEWYDDEDDPYEEKLDVPVLFYTIKNKIGWGKWCDVTGHNHYALNEGYDPSDTEVFYCSKSQAEELGI